MPFLPRRSMSMKSNDGASPTVTPTSTKPRRSRSMKGGQVPPSLRTSSTSSDASRRRSSGSQFVAEAMKEMDPQTMIELMEMYANSSDDRGFECLQTLKNSEDEPKSRRSSKK